MTTPLDRWMGEVATSLEVLSNDRFDADYEGRFGEPAMQHGDSVKVRAKLYHRGDSRMPPRS